MNLTRFDIVIVFTMSLAVVLMSFVFPAVGLTSAGDEVNESDVPSFNISSTEWDIAGDFPEQVGTPTSGTLVYDEERGSGIEGQSLVWIDRPKSNGTAIELQNGTTVDEFQIVVTHFNDSAASGRDAQDRYNINAEGDTVLHQNLSWVIDFQVTELNNYQETNMTAEVDWQLDASPDAESGGGISAIPVLGGLFDAGVELASFLAYLGLIIRWAIATFFELTLTMVSILLTVMVFAVDTLSWLFNSYASVVSGAPSGFAAVVTAIPGLLLSLEFAKLGMIGVSLLPTT